MAHEISQTNGVASFADSRVDTQGQVDAWHKLGTPVGHAMTAQEALDAAYLSKWNVRKRPLWVDIREDNPEAYGQKNGLVVPRQYATVFDNPVTKEITPIGVVGERYTPINNEELTEFADALVDEGGAHYETAGSLRDYSQVFLTMKLPRELKLVNPTTGKIDTTEYYLAIFNSHDGSSSMFGVVTTVRVVCANTARVAISGAESKFSVRHTSGYRAAVQEAREQLSLVWEYEEAFEAEVRDLFADPFSSDDMKAFAEELVKLDKVEEDSVAATKRRNEAGAIHKLFVESPTIKGTAIEGTKWAAFNAITEYVDHYATVRNGGDDPEAIRASRTLALATAGGRAGETDGLKADAWKLLSSN